MTDYINPKLIIRTDEEINGSVAWRSPSNIAIIKYWGKYGNQLPRNPSVSFTLDSAYTETTIEYEVRKGTNQDISLQFTFGEEANHPFGIKIKQFLAQVSGIFPFLKQLELKIHSFNSFPHSAGIASSASAMSALALCLCSIEDELFDTLKSDTAFERKSSYIARLGSGSACRSIYGRLALWGEMPDIMDSSNEYAIPMQDLVHPVFHSYHDDILIIDDKAKQVSSRAGHGLMDNNIYAENRYQQARQRMYRTLEALKKGDVELLGTILEDEAMTLHAMMMCISPSFTLLHPNTLVVIDAVRTFRKEQNIPLYFSLDAGPNVHLLYPAQYFIEVTQFIESHLKQFCIQQEYIQDEAGEGPVQL